MTGLPSARAHGGVLRRLRAFLLVGPRHATAGLFAWARTLAIASGIAHLAYFLVAVAVAASLRGFDGERQVGALLTGLLVAPFCAGLVWLVTIVVALVAGAVTWPMPRGRRGVAAVLGALWIGCVLVVIEPIAAAVLHLLIVAMESGAWTYPTYAISGALGIVWGAWLADAITASQRARAERTYLE